MGTTSVSSVDGGFGPGALATCDGRQVGQRVALEVLAHVFAHVVPDRQEDALALVVTGAVFVRLAEITHRDRAVDRTDDLGQVDLRRRPSQDVATAHAPLGPHEPRT